MSGLWKTSASCAVLAIFCAAPAVAADVFGRESVKDAPSAFDAPRISWSGVYIGGAIGYGNANHDLTVNDYFKDYCSAFSETDGFDKFAEKNRDWTIDQSREFFSPGVEAGEIGWYESCEKKITAVNPTVLSDTPAKTITGDSREVGSLDGLNSTGIVGDVRLGYDQQVNRFLIGIFGSYGLSSMEASGEQVGFGSFDLERGDDWSVGARAGVLVNDRTLLYILAAYTQTEYDLRVTADDETSSKTTTFDGWTVGGGVEFALASNVFLGIEGTHTFYGSETIFDVYDPATNVGTSVEDDLGETKIMGTLKIKLNTGLFGN